MHRGKGQTDQTKHERLLKLDKGSLGLLSYFLLCIFEGFHNKMFFCFFFLKDVRTGITKITTENGRDKAFLYY